MKTIFNLTLLFLFTQTFAQQPSRSTFYQRVFTARYMDTPPVFAYGRDSLKRFFYDNFPAFDTVINTAVKNGDTAKFIRVYFTFNLDESGILYEPHFVRVASSRSAVTESAKTINYFYDMADLLKIAVRQILHKMPRWQPGLQNGIPVKTHNENFLQFWLGLTPPQ